MQIKDFSLDEFLKRYPQVTKRMKLLSLISLVVIVVLWAINEIIKSQETFQIKMGRTIIDGLAFSMLLFLMVSGFFLIFGLCDIVNFAHGAFFMLGGFLGYEIYLATESLLLNYSIFENNLFVMSLTAFIIACILTAAVLGILGGAIEYVTIRRLYGQLVGQVLLTVGFMYIITKFCEIWWGSSVFTFTIEASSEKNYFFLGFTDTIDLGRGLVFSMYRIVLIFVGFAIAGIMFLIFQRTRIGLLIQAGIEDPEMVEALGTNIRMMFTFVFMAGAALAGLAGIVLVPWLGANSGHGTTYLLYAFVIVVVGGAHYGRFEGTFFGSLIVGLATKWTEYFYSELTGVIVFLIMVIILIFKPGGLTGEA